MACSLVVPLVTTTVLPCKSFGAEMVEAFGTISLVPATNISGENATCLAALGVRRGRSAFEVDLVLHHRRNAVIRGDLDVVDPQIGVVDLDADLVDDGLAKFEAVADRPVGRIHEGERRRAFAVAEPHHMVLLDGGERRAEPFARWSAPPRPSSADILPAAGRRPHAILAEGGAWLTSYAWPVSGRAIRRGSCPAAPRRRVRARARARVRLPISPPPRWRASCRSHWWRCVPCRGRCRCP